MKFVNLQTVGVIMMAQISIANAAEIRPIKSALLPASYEIFVDRRASSDVTSAFAIEPLQVIKDQKFRRSKFDIGGCPSSIQIGGIIIDSGSLLTTSLDVTTIIVDSTIIIDC